MKTKKSTARERMMADPDVQGCILADRFAKRSGLRPGNLWEPGISRKIAADIREHGYEYAERKWTFQLFGEEI